MTDMQVIKEALAADKNMRIRLTDEDAWHVYMYSQPNATTWTMTRKTMSTSELANFIRSGGFAKGEYIP